MKSRSTIGSFFVNNYTLLSISIILLMRIKYEGNYELNPGFKILDSLHFATFLCSRFYLVILLHVSEKYFDSYYHGRGRNRQLRLISFLWTSFPEHEICLTYGELFKQICSLEHSTNNLIWKHQIPQGKKVVLLCHFMTDFHTSDLWKCVKLGLLSEAKKKILYILKPITLNDGSQNLGMFAKIKDERTKKCHVLSRTYWLSYGSHLFSYIASQKPWEQANTNCYR